MFTPQQNCQWWAERYKFVRTWKHDKTPLVLEIRAVTYRNMMVAAFTHLFNYRLKQKGVYL